MGPTKISHQVGLHGIGGPFSIRDIAVVAYVEAEFLIALPSIEWTLSTREIYPYPTKSF